MKELHRVQVATELRIKTAEYKHVLFYQELVHLRVFDKREERLEERKVQRREDLQQTVAALKTANTRLTVAQKDVTRFTAQEKAVHSQFASVMADNQKLEKVLTKIFKKKVVRSKKRGGDGDSDSGSDSEDMEDMEDEDGDMDGSDDDEEIDETVCPPGCDPAVYERVMSLREQRATAEESLAETKKTVEMLKKDIDSLSKKEKATQAQMAAADKDIAAFQLEKQGRLNELSVAVPVHLRQIKYLVDGGFPRDLSDTVLFDVSSIEQLQQRIASLTEEKSMQRKEYKEIKQTQARMSVEKSKKDAELEQLKKKCDELQMLKFGMLVDLDALNTFSINHAAEELKDKQLAQQREHELALAEMDKEIEAAQLELTERTRQNTAMLEAVAAFEKDKRQLEKSLNASQRKVAMASSVAQQSEESRRRLEAIGEAQAAEASRLRYEIHRLTRKAGHVLPPSPGRPTSVEKLPPLDQRS